MGELVDKYEYARIIDSMKHKPGQAILMLPEEKRSILQQLKSSDISDVRWPRV
jgi:hypothetical protein